MNAQVNTFAELENLSDLEPTFMTVQAKAATVTSVRRYSNNRYNSGWKSAYNPTPAPTWDDQHKDCIDKINVMASRGSNFGKSVQTYYNSHGYMHPNHVIAVRKIIADDTARVTERTVQPITTPVAVTVPTNAIDLRSLPDGRYAVPNGDTRLKVLINRSDDPKWEGFIFVSDAAAYGQRQKYGMQAAGRMYRGKIEEQLRTILSNPKAATVAYGRLTNHCGCCGKPLEDVESVARGIGPVCAKKNGWL